MSQVASVARPSQGLIASSTPTAVATPLPPLKWKYSGQRWPRKAPKPASAAHHSTASSPRPKRCAAQRAASTGTTPLSASSSSVATAAFLLPERSTLVAPGLPEP